MQLHFSFLRTHPDATIMKIAILYMVCAIMVPITAVCADLAAEGRALTDVAIAWPRLQTGDIFTNLQIPVMMGSRECNRDSHLPP